LHCCSAAAYPDNPDNLDNPDYQFVFRIAAIKSFNEYKYCGFFLFPSTMSDIQNGNILDYLHTHPPPSFIWTFLDEQIAITLLFTVGFVSPPNHKWFGRSEWSKKRGKWFEMIDKKKEKKRKEKKTIRIAKRKVDSS